MPILKIDSLPEVMKSDSISPRGMQSRFQRGELKSEEPEGKVCLRCVVLSAPWEQVLSWVGLLKKEGQE